MNPKINIKETSVVDRLIGEKIQHLRLIQGMTRQELADKIGVTHQQLQKYEKGVNRIAASRLVDIAEAMKVNVVYFFEQFLETMPDETLNFYRQNVEIMRDFAKIKRDDQKEAVTKLIKALAEEENGSS